MEAVLQNLVATFDGKETEHNWSKRHEACRDIIPSLCHSDAAKQSPAKFTAGIRQIIDGLMSCAKSERTQLSNEACKALQEVSKTAGLSIHPMIDIIVPPLIDVCGFTKPVSQKNGSETVESIVRNAGYHLRVLHYITSTSSDKRKPPRVAAAKWLKIFVATYHRDLDKAPASLDAIERAINAGLGDNQKDVRETMRATYWTFSKYWSVRADGLLTALPKAAQTALLADSHNPERRTAAAQAPAVGKKSASESARAFILAKKKKLAEEGSFSDSSANVIVQTGSENVKSAKVREPVLEKDGHGMELGASEQQRVASGLLAEPARRRIVAVSTAKAPHPPRPLSAQPAVGTPHSNNTPSSRPTSSSSAMPPPVAPLPASRPLSISSSAVMSQAPSATTKHSTRKPVGSKERLNDLMTKPVDGAQEENKENSRAPGLADKRDWARKETVEVNQRSISPITKDPAAARRLIARGIKGMSENTIDDVGYRRLQSVIKEHDNIFYDEPKYDDMLLALCNTLERPSSEERRPLGKKHDNKFQTLVVMRLMLEHNRKYFAAYYPRAMTALISARGNYDTRSHIVSSLEATAEEIVKLCQPSDVIDAVLTVAELSDPSEELGVRCLAMSLHVLSGLITRTQILSIGLEEEQEQRMAALGMNCLRSPHVSVKRAVIEYSVKLHEVILPESRYFQLLTNGVEDLENLITYYVTASEAGRVHATEGAIQMA